MKIGPKFKIAKRLGAPIFEKTQSQKFTISESRVGKTQKRRGQMSDYKRQLIEKQKMRFTYGITERQLERYVNESMAKGHQPIAQLMERLETRLDNAVYRLGLAKTRRFARQMVSHGHVTVNGKKITTPSYKVVQGDQIAVREGSKNSGLFVNLSESFESSAVPAWLSFDIKKMAGEVVGAPVYDPSDSMFDADQVLEYYSR